MTNRLCIHITDAQLYTAALATFSGPPSVFSCPCNNPLILVFNLKLLLSKSLRQQDTNKLIQLPCTYVVQLNILDKLQCRCEWEIATMSPEEHWIECVCVCLSLSLLMCGFHLFWCIPVIINKFHLYDNIYRRWLFIHLWLLHLLFCFNALRNHLHACM